MEIPLPTRKLRVVGSFTTTIRGASFESLRPMAHTEGVMQYDDDDENDPDAPQESDLDDLGGDDDEPDEGDLVRCPACGHAFYYDAGKCPHCGEWRVGGSSVESGGLRRWLMVIIVACLIAVVLVVWHGLGR